jgi:hypothetical protein
MFFQIDSKYKTADSVSDTDFNVDLETVRRVFRGDGMIRLKSFTYSYTFYQITPKNNTFTVAFNNGSTRSVNILGVGGSSGNISGAQLSANIVAQMNVNTAGQTFTAVVSNTTGRLTITASLGVFSITSGNDKTHEVLGMDADTTLPPAASITLPYVVNLTPIRYLLLHTNFPTKSGNYDNFSNKTNNVFAKIPVNSSFFSNVHYEAPDSEFRHINEVLPKVNIKITDGEYNQIDFNKINFQIEFEYKNLFNNT